MAKRKGSERNWKEYDEHLVKQGEILLDLESEGLEKRTLGEKNSLIGEKNSLR